MKLNIIWINGWLGKYPSYSLHLMRSAMHQEFPTVYSQEPFNHYDTAGILAAVKRYKDPTGFVALSCGCSTINECLKWVSPAAEVVPFAMYLSPSFPCGIDTRPVPVVVKRAIEVNSAPGDWFNMTQAQAITLAPGNKTTVLLPRIRTMSFHGNTPGNEAARNALRSEIKRALAA